VARFWEKPAADVAAMVQARGGLWNSLVMVGCLGAFLDLFTGTVPMLWEAFAPLRASLGRLGEVHTARQVYAGLLAVDFSRFVLQAVPEQLAVVPVRGVGWNDLGDPSRLRMTQALCVPEGGRLTVRPRSRPASRGLREATSRTS